MIKMAKDKWENCEFPQLRDIADPKKLVPRLQRCLATSFTWLAASFTPEVIVDECAIDDLYYKPGAHCRLVLNAKLHREHVSESHQQIFFGKLFRSQSAAQEALDSISHEDLTKPK